MNQNMGNGIDGCIGQVRMGAHRIRITNAFFVEPSYRSVQIQFSRHDVLGDITVGGEVRHDDDVAGHGIDEGFDDVAGERQLPEECRMDGGEGLARTDRFRVREHRIRRVRCALRSVAQNDEGRR